MFLFPKINSRHRVFCRNSILGDYMKRNHVLWSSVVVQLAVAGMAYEMDPLPPPRSPAPFDRKWLEHPMVEVDRVGETHF